MKNKYLFDQNKEELLKNTELNVSEAKKIPADQLSDYSNAVSECDEIMEERKKDESNYMERMKEFLQKLFALTLLYPISSLIQGHLKNQWLRC